MTAKHIHEFLGEMAAPRADAIAIEHDSRQLTYADLDAASRKLAGFLIEAGAPKGALVALLIDQPIEIIPAILGVLRAGCVFVPLDARAPDLRLETMLQQALPAYVITDADLLSRAARVVAASGASAEILSINRAQPPADFPKGLRYHADFQTYQPDAVEYRIPEPDAICYIYFTSGSTGTPKGIAGCLKAVDHFIQWEITTFEIDEQIRVSQLTAPSFDAFLRDMFVPLCAGGTICLPDDKNTVAHAERLIDWLDIQAVNLIHCVPSVFRSIVNAQPDPSFFMDLRYILMAGEPLLPSDVRKWIDIFGDRVQLVNLYGPSETTMTKFSYLVQPTDAQRAMIPIGKPMPGAAAIVVDERGRPSPRRAVGEIYIRTPYRSLGYYNQPELTQQVFIQNPFSDDPNDIVYKTGDLGRILEDGQFEFLGRKDQQVKIRGIRIELDEIKELLLRNEAVKDVAVIDRDDGNGYTYLCAYVVMPRDADTTKLKEDLAAHLPEYMIPSAFVVMDSLPRLLNGKVDRRLLPSPAKSRELSFVAPRSSVEEVLANIFAQVLGVGRVGIYDNFLESGGHSLLATQFLARVHDAFQIDVALRTFFEGPTVAALAQYIETRQRSDAGLELPSLTPGPRPERLPLSFAQQRLWFLSQLSPTSPFYNIPSAWRIHGAIDPALLEQSLNELARRHEVLRTSFAVRDGVPFQQIHATISVPFDVIDITDVSADQREATLREHMQAEALHFFDLEHGPLLRASLVSLGCEEHVLLFTIHHTLADGWSLAIVAQELAAIYDALVAGRPSGLPALPIQYADYTLWQREWLAPGAALDQQLAFWQEQLAGAPEQLDLPTDHPRPAVETFRGVVHYFTLPAELVEGVRLLSRQNGVTLFMTLLSAFGTLLGRYAGQDEVVIGTPVANRRQTVLEGLIGCFINTLPLRVTLTGRPSFRELLGRVRETTLNAYTHQDLPFELLVDSLNLQRDVSRHPLFQAFLVLQNAPGAVIDLPSLRIEPLVSDTETARFDLSISFQEHDQTLTGELRYNRDLFEQPTILRLIGHFEQLLRACVAAPDQPIVQLPLLPETEQQQIAAWGVGQQNAAPRELAHDLIAQQAARTPAAIAVIDGERQLTYAELEGRANRLARHLIRLGVGPDTCVGLWLERSYETIIALLAIFKAGGVAVPLDSLYPTQRIAFMLEDARVAVLITHSTLAATLDSPSAQLLCLDQAAAAIAAEPADAPQVELAGENLAYLIYTSGSTGVPKAVMVEHRNLAHVLHASQQQFGFQAGDVMPWIAPIIFDIALFELLNPLVAGGTTLIFPYGQTLEASYVTAALRRVTVVHAVPALLAHMVQMAAESGPASVYDAIRMIFVGGDVVPPELLVSAQQVFRRAQLTVLYGPTEATIICLAHPVTADQPVTGHVIGRPLPNVAIRISDRYDQPAPIGVPGELHIGGAGVARGYLHQAELTAERYCEQDGQRWYRTGDLARYRADGSVEFMGRADAQVKLRGFRIELGEIESALAQHPAVQASVVLLREDGPGSQRLVAYVVPEESGTARQEPKERQHHRASAAHSDTIELWPSIGEYAIYDEVLYYGLANDTRRIAGYTAALERAVKDQVVVEIGTGNEAILARQCIAAGARRVYALEVLDAPYRAAAARIHALGLDDRVIVLHGDATTTALPEPADVCVSAIFEAIGGGEGASEILNRSRRLLKPGGVMIPARSVTKIAAVSLPDALAADPRFTHVSGYYVEQIFAQVGHPFDVRLCIKDFPRTQILSGEGIFEDLDFRDATASAYCDPLSLTIERAGRFNGFVLWLNLHLIDGVVLDALDHAYAWFPVYFPIFDPGIAVEPGDRIEGMCSASLSSDGIHPDYAVEGRLIQHDGTETPFAYRSVHHEQRYKATPFYRRLFGDGTIPILPPAQHDDLIADVRSYLQTRLPNYMVPSAFVLLDRLPLTVQGKVDRRALPAPEATRPELSSEFVAPQTPTQQQLADILVAVLQIDQIGIHDSFFALGGHSLLAIQVLRRVNDMFQIDMPLRAIFETPTVAGLAEAVDVYQLAAHGASAAQHDATVDEEEGVI